MDKRLTRSNDRMFLGVAAGLANYFNIDPAIIRLLFAIATILGAGSPILLYIILAIVMPNDDYAGTVHDDDVIFHDKG